MLSLLNPRNLIVAGVLVLVIGAWGYGMWSYRQGYAAAEAAQKAIDLQTVTDTLENWNETTSRPISPDVADCILRSIATGGSGEKCRVVSGQ